MTARKSNNLLRAFCEVSLVDFLVYLARCGGSRAIVEWGRRLQPGRSGLAHGGAGAAGLVDVPVPLLGEPLVAEAAPEGLDTRVRVAVRPEVAGV